MLHQMCQTDLTDADLKAIIKNRHFSSQEVHSRGLLESFFLSDVGVVEALSSLSQEEVALLYLLKFLGDLVDVSCFARIYGQKDGRYYGSFNQRYQPMFKKVRESLVHKGLLLMAAIDDPNAKSKMERWRFRFPREFEPFLPPFFGETTPFSDGGDVRIEVPRRKLLELAEGPPKSPLSQAVEKNYQVNLVDGVLYIGNHPFREQWLRDWQRACWQAAGPQPEHKPWPPRDEKRVAPIEAATYILTHLPSGEWLRPDQMLIPLRVFCNAALDPEALCLTGWYWGCLARQKVGEMVYYRLSDNESEAEPEPIYYLHAPQGQPLTANLEKIPYSALEQLVQIADFSVTRTGKAYPVVRPNLKKIGLALTALGDSQLAQWLQAHSPEFRQAFETAATRWGKQLVHENLLIARVNDLALKVQLERAFPDRRQLIFLPNNYLAFAKELLADVEKIIAKSGHVIRRVDPYG